MNPRSVFDESWYRVRGIKVRLLPGIEMVRQMFRGEYWYVVCDTMGHRYFRIRPGAYQFICHMEVSDTVEEAWEKSLDADPEGAPGQGEVIQLLSQLYQSGLLRSDKAVNIQMLDESLKKEKKAQNKQLWSSLLFLKIPLFNPDPFLRKTSHLFSWCFKPIGLLLWLVLFGLGMQALVENWARFADNTRSILGIANLPYLYGSLVITKVLHEFGHAYACRRYGREVPQMGVMLLVFNPLPYVDASASYALAQRYRRVVVGIAGMAVELFVAAIAIVIWSYAGDGVLSRVCYNVAITASVATLLFNLNPLLRFDGYHILCDFLETPNLQGRSQSLMSYWINKHAYKIEPGPCPVSTRGQKIGFTTYFLASWVYRLVLMFGILIFVSKQLLILGVILALIFGFIWTVVPTVKAAKYLFTSPRLMNRRARAIGITTLFLGGIFAFLIFVPMPHYFRAQGVVKSSSFQNIYSTSAGQISEVVAESGAMVKKGDVLVRLVNKELLKEQELITIERRRANLLIRQDRSEQGTQLAGLKAFVVALDEREEAMKQRIEELVVKAPIDGRWISDDLHEVLGNAVPRGARLGIVRGEEGYVFSAVLHQRNVGRIFSNKLTDTEVKLHGEEGLTLSLISLDAIPAQQNELPSAALGVSGGGSLGVNPQDSSGSATTEPYFQVRGVLHDLNGASPNHGQRGVARFPLPNKPLWDQWSQSLRQFFQREYQL